MDGRSVFGTDGEIGFTRDGSHAELRAVSVEGVGEKPARLADGLRVWQPPGVTGLSQSGVYSKFALAGDCEVTLKYEMPLAKPTHTGCTVGLAFDTDEGGGSGEIQLVNGSGSVSGFTMRAGGSEKHDVVNRLVANGVCRGDLVCGG
jgi:hypothetical protein